MDKKLLVFLFLLCFGNIYSQTIKGKILNATSLQPVENSTIFNLASEVIAVSNSKGEFGIKAEKFPVMLHISADGFADQLVEIKNSDQKIEIYLILTSEVLSEVIIRSTMIPIKLQKIPASVSLISAEDLKRIDASNLVTAFNNVPGVYVNQGALNTTKLNIRGIGARSQYSTNRIQAYFNEIPLTTAEGELTLDDIDLESLSGIEVIKGPTSSLYG
ncbi:MAG: TonB-dependent receptor plug domain-containing protein, partial [Flavobacteriaceae bacterium]|nr:TonB-dependent receptor plug domain-containing protein [Flavobacteriaceae bacterium]